MTQADYEKEKQQAADYLSGMLDMHEHITYADAFALLSNAIVDMAVRCAEEKGDDEALQDEWAQQVKTYAVSVLDITRSMIDVRLSEMIEK